MSGDGRRAIVFASEYYPPFAPGGAEWTNAAWAEALARRGHRVVVVTPNYGAAPRELAAGVDVVRVPFPLKLAPGQGAARGIVHRNPLWDFYFARRLTDVARRHDARVIHAQGKGALVASWRAARRLGRPVVATIRDLGLICPLGMCTLFEPWETFDCSAHRYTGTCVPFYLREYEKGSGAGRRARLWLSLRLAWLDHVARRHALSRVDGVIGVSRAILDLFPPRIVPRDRRYVVHSLPPAAPVPTPAAAERTRHALGIGAGPLVLYAGKRSLGKGTPVLLAALDAIRAAVPGVRFAFAGKGETTLPQRDDVHALGVLSHAQLFPLYRAADLVVSPSVWPEPMSRVIIEAMHFGRPVVATGVGGSLEQVADGVTGRLVPKNDAGALADAVVALLRDPVGRERMGAAARERVAALFSEDKVVSALLDVYAAADRRTA
jgi:glycosyltransferase involved in cell wall biosynthesis